MFSHFCENSDLNSEYEHNYLPNIVINYNYNIPKIMKTIKLVSIALIMIMVTSCASKMHFPVSDIAPAADISMTKKTDSNNNYEINLTAKNLAAADRIAPLKTTYVLWIVTTSGEVKNAGQLDVRNARKAGLKTVTPFDFHEAFITAEEKGDVQEPAGLEITRIRFNH